MPVQENENRAENDKDGKDEKNNEFLFGTDQVPTVLGIRFTLSETMRSPSLPFGKCGGGESGIQYNGVLSRQPNSLYNHIKIPKTKSKRYISRASFSSPSGIVKAENEKISLPVGKDLVITLENQ